MLEHLFVSVSELEQNGILLVQDGNHGEYRPRSGEFVKEGIAFIRAADIQNGEIAFATAERINGTALARIRKGIGKPRDVIFSSKGTVGKIARTSPACEPFVCSPQTSFWRSLEPEILCPSYLYYFMCSDLFREQWESRKGETDMADYVSLTAQRELKVFLVDADTQRSITSLLDPIHARIGLNEKQNMALEATAAAVFKSWFVDFDPVVAKSEGRKPFGMTDEVAALFPDHFDATGVPDGWSLLPLTECFEVNPKRLIAGSKSIYLEMSNLPTVGHGALDWTLRKFGSGLRFKNGDTLVARITPCLENGKTCFVDFLENNDVAWGSTEYIVLQPMPPIPAFVGYLLARTNDFRTFAISRMTGSSGRQRVPTESLSQYEFPQADAEVWKAFERIVGPMFERMKLNNNQNRALRKLRDAILPGLVSGELQIRDAEREVAGVLG